MTRTVWALVFFGLVGPSVCEGKSETKNKPKTLLSQPMLSVRVLRATAPLTNAVIWKSSAPTLPSPHRMRWWVAREVRPLQLRAVPRGAAKFKSFKAELSGVEAVLKIWTRDAKSPLFKPWSEYACNGKPSDYFGTLEGAGKAAETAAENYRELLDSYRARLTLQLSQITELSETDAVEVAQTIFESWLSEIDRDWMAQGFVKARAAEWAYYRERVRADAVCDLGSEHPLQKTTVKGTIHRTAEDAALRSWENAMEAPGVSVDAEQAEVVRAPARRWGGAYTVKATVEVAGIRMVGQFLIDSEAPVSLMDPAWMARQGVKPGLTRVPGPPLRFDWAFGRGIGLPAEVDEVWISGKAISGLRWHLFQPLAFQSPRYLSSCCDGVLGQDFLSQFTVELDPKEPTHIKLHPRGATPFGKDASWLEVFRGGDHEWDYGRLVSRCRTEKDQLVTVLWSLAGAGAVQFESTAAKDTILKSNQKGFYCGGTVFGGIDRAELVVDRSLVSWLKPLAVSSGVIRAGADFLYRSAIALDLGSGRLWFESSGLTKSWFKNRTGLVVDYGWVNGDRTLKVIGIEKNSPAQALVTQGLKPGKMIEKISDRDGFEVDLWEVQQILAGARGRELKLQIDGIKLPVLAIPNE